ncbi:MAG: hypothetical protein MUC57_04890 [Desulfobacterales bacterium]|jgi:hypothetical protein|nr:hypothetical protein [Desulfobacterales bacterium]
MITGNLGTSRFWAWVWLAIVLALLSGCSTANRGGLRNSREVGRAFETFHIYPNHRYWYYYLENNPFAVVGLEPPYRIEDINWKEVDPDSKTFEKVVGLVEHFPATGAYTYGAFILDPQARQIGVWYSSLSAGIVVDPESQVVSVNTAMPWINDDGWYGSGVGVGIGSGGGGIGIRLGF